MKKKFAVENLFRPLEARESERGREDELCTVLPTTTNVKIRLKATARKGGPDRNSTLLVKLLGLKGTSWQHVRRKKLTVRERGRGRSKKRNL